MFTKFKSHTCKIFLDSDVEAELEEGLKADVILSPALYWVRRFSLPVRSLKEAKKLLPSLFEEFLPEGDFDYYGYFDGDDFIAFAFEQRAIKKVLAEKKIPLSRVEGFYFAQNEIDKNLLPLRISERFILSEADGIVVRLPASFAPTAKKLDLKSIERLSSHQVHLEHFSTSIDKKSLMALSFVLLGFLLLYGAEWFRLHQARVEAEQKKSEIFTQYGLLPTMMQNRALMKKYEKIDRTQKRFRTFFASVLHVPLKKEERLHLLSWKKGVATLVFENIKDAKRVTEYFKRDFTLRKSSFKEHRLVMELQI